MSMALIITAAIVLIGFSILAWVIVSAARDNNTRD
jgi:uncharacterized membrane protein